MRSDAELVDAVLSGDREVFVDLVHRYEDAVRATILAIVRNHHTTQDVTQDTFVAAYEKLGGLRDGSAFGAWLLQIARRRAVDAVKRTPRTEPLDGLEMPGSPRNGELDETSGDLLTAVLRLPEHERTVVMLNYFAGHKLAEIAEMTGRPLGTVTTQLTRARDRLRGWLTELEP
jgi:RNA polymerase sigma-70 factor (ECF subfamily)